MTHKPLHLIHLFLILITVVVLSGCSPLIQRQVAIDTTPALIVSVEKGEVEEPNSFVDLATFPTSLLQALSNRDAEKLRMWMTEPFLAGTWRGALSYVSRRCFKCALHRSAWR